MSEQEEWRWIEGYPHYRVSNLGRVVSHWRRKEPFELRCGVDKDGYLKVGLVAPSGHRRRFSVHTLVALAFVGPRPDGHQIRHLDGCPANNAFTNLAWGTKSENERDKIRHGTHPEASKTHCVHGHAFTPENTWHRTSGSGHARRVCRTCHDISKGRLSLIVERVA